MKVMLVLAGLGFAAAPASAQVVHQTSVTHNGRTIALSYESQVDTSFRQTGLGPRSSATCFWKSQVSVKRTAIDANGQPIAALSRVVKEAKPTKGSQPGLCATVSARRTAAFKGNEGELRKFLANVAENDAGALRTAMASLAAPSAETHAR